MAANSVDLSELCRAVRAVLLPVEGIGKVEDRPGGVPTWVEQARHLRTAPALWEIDVVSSSEQGAAVGTQAFEQPVIKIDGFMPWSYSNPDSAAVWRPLVTRVLNQLRTYPTFANQIAGFRGAGLPQLMRNERVPVLDGEKQLLCHHCEIRVTGERWFTYTVSTSL